MTCRISGQSQFVRGRAAPAAMRTPTLRGTLRVTDRRSALPCGSVTLVPDQRIERWLQYRVRHAAGGTLTVSLQSGLSHNNRLRCFCYSLSDGLFRTTVMDSLSVTELGGREHCERSVATRTSKRLPPKSATTFSAHAKQAIHLE